MTAPDNQIIRRFTDPAMAHLRLMANNDPDFFLDPNCDTTLALDITGILPTTQPTELTSPDPAPIFRRTAGTDRHGLELHRAIRGLQPRHLADPNLLAWMSCVHQRELAARWNPRKNQKKSHYVLQHYLAANHRFMTTASIAGRPLWMAQIAIRAASNDAPFDAKQAFDFLAANAEIYGYCIHHTVLHAPNVLTQYLASVMLDAPRVRPTGARRLARDLNLSAAAILIDALSPDEVRRIIIKCRASMPPHLFHPPGLDV